MQKITKGTKVKIKTGAIVGQDFSFYKWGKESIIFTIDSNSSKNRYKLVADGYGNLKGNYGNGAVYANKSDLIVVSEIKTGGGKMKLKQFVEGLNKLIQERPETADFDVVVAEDDEGSYFNLVYYNPSIGYYDSKEKQFYPEKKLNAVCIN